MIEKNDKMKDKVELAEKNVETANKDAGQVEQAKNSDAKENGAELPDKSSQLNFVEKPKLTKAELAEKERKRKETENFKKQYFEFYDDIKISHREDW